MTEQQLNWIKSSYSGAPSDDCVEAALLPDGRVAVRDSKRRDGVCRFSPTVWGRFIADDLSCEVDRR
ncbi:DUF397 domain-containing protein [Streptomyces sp. NPDC048172]|uniref:DUF397 domain-containing protein n=1 Tax=Streptomyces sp. NPDC048172 TaxID=3365505 RepID=UPI003712C7D5